MADVGAVSLGSLVAEVLGVVIDLALFRVVRVAFGLLLGLDLFVILFKFSVIQSGAIGKYYSHCLYSLPSPPQNGCGFRRPTWRISSWKPCRTPSIWKLGSQITRSRRPVPASRGS